MLEWIKLESSILLDSRIQALLNDHGFCGLGLYVAMRTAIDSISEDGLPLPQVLAVGVPRTRKKKMLNIIENYGLFNVSELGIVTSCPLTPAHTPGHTPAQMSGHTPGQMPAQEQVIDIDREEKKEIDNIREWLLSPSNLIWREPLMMQSGYSSLLQKYWNEAVEFFIQHTLAQDNISAMPNEHEARQYFSNFCRLSVGSGQRLKNYLQELSQKEESINHTPSTINQNGVQYYNGRPLPPDAPPRPSTTAEWDDASGTWFELYH